jgi:hypothetical protein
MLGGVGKRRRVLAPERAAVEEEERPRDSPDGGDMAGLPRRSGLIA